MNTKFVTVSASVLLGLGLLFVVPVSTQAQEFFDGGDGGSYFDGGDYGSYYDGGDGGSYYDGGSDPYFYDGGDDPYFYDGGDDPYFNDGNDDPYFYDGGDDPYFNEGNDDPYFYDGGDDPYFYDGGDDPYFNDGYDAYDAYDVYETYIEQEGVKYSSSAGHFSNPVFSSAPIRVSTPGFSSPRPSPVTPIPAPRPQPVSTPVTNNTCVNNSCNSTVTQIDNSINGSFNDNSIRGSFNVTTLTPVTPQRPVQYVFPHVPPPLPIAPAPYVSLSQIPYTGFEGGPLESALYFGGLLAFAAAAAYLVLYFKGGIGSVFAGFTPMKAAAVATPLVFKQASFPVRSPIQLVRPEKKDIHRPTIFSAPKDSMTVVASKNGSAPHIVISRS